MTKNRLLFDMELYRIDRETAKANYVEYIKRIPGEIENLECTIRQVPGFNNWTANYTRDSLENLSKAIPKTGYVKGREQTPEEIKASYTGLPEPVSLIAQVHSDAEVLTETSKEFLTGLSMYFGETLINNADNLVWTFWKRKEIIHQQPVVKGLSKVVCAPMELMCVYGYKLLAKKDVSGYLSSLYDQWTQILQDRDELAAIHREELKPKRKR